MLFHGEENNFVKGKYSTAFGKDNIISPSIYSAAFDGSGSFAFGLNTTVAHHSFAFGENTVAGS